MSKYTWKNLIEEVLRESSAPLKVDEIWTRANDQKLPENLTNLTNKEGPTYQSCRSAIYGKSARRWLGRMESSESIRFFLLDSEPVSEKDAISIDNAKTSFKEKDMHLLLASFVHSSDKFFGSRAVYTKTIAESSSVDFGKKQHPDMVGVYLPFSYGDDSDESDMGQEVIALNEALNARTFCQLFSFELKLEINNTNYSDIFYQVINNSTWANHSYLVVTKISGGKKTQELVDELARLNQAHGIGVIVLNRDDFNQSVVLFPTKVRDQLDWMTINKLCSNKDFKSFVTRVRKDVINRSIEIKAYDKVKNSNI